MSFTLSPQLLLLFLTLNLVCEHCPCRNDFCILEVIRRVGLQHWDGELDIEYLGAHGHLEDVNRHGLPLLAVRNIDLDILRNQIVAFLYACFTHQADTMAHAKVCVQSSRTSRAQKRCQCEWNHGRCHCGDHTCKRHSNLCITFCGRVLQADDARSLRFHVDDDATPWCAQIRIMLPRNTRSICLHPLQKYDVDIFAVRLEI